MKSAKSVLGRLNIMNKQKGFTFIEVLISLVIISIALVAATLASSNTLKNAGYVQEKLFAHWIADNRLAEIKIQRNSFFPNTGSTDSKTIEFAGREWTWVQKIDKTAGDNIRNVTIEVYLGDSSDDKKPIAFLISNIIDPKDLSQ